MCSSDLGLGNGFLLTILVVTAAIVEIIDRRFHRAAAWCIAAAAFSWVGLMHSATLAWGAQPMFAVGWLAAGAVMASARWWSGETRP